MGARSWSERRSRPSSQPPGLHHPIHMPHPSPQSQQQYTPALSHHTSVLYNLFTMQERQRLQPASQRDRQVRLQSVRRDLALNLPVSIALPDGEEHPYGSMKRFHLRDAEQESEIYRGYIRPPPNRTVPERESPPPYRSNSSGLLHKSNRPPRIVRTADGTPLVMRSHGVNLPPANRSSYPQGFFPSIPPTHLWTQPLAGGCRDSNTYSNTTDSLQPPGYDQPPSYSEVVGSRDLCGITREDVDGGV